MNPKGKDTKKKAKRKPKTARKSSEDERPPTPESDSDIVNQLFDEDFVTSTEGLLPEYSATNNISMKIPCYCVQQHKYAYYNPFQYHIHTQMAPIYKSPYFHHHSNTAQYPTTTQQELFYNYNYHHQYPQWK